MFKAITVAAAAITAAQAGQAHVEDSKHPHFSAAVHERLRKAQEELKQLDTLSPEDALSAFMASVEKAKKANGGSFPSGKVQATSAPKALKKSLRAEGKGGKLVTFDDIDYDEYDDKFHAYYFDEDALGFLPRGYPKPYGGHHRNCVYVDCDKVTEGDLGCSFGDVSPPFVAGPWNFGPPMCMASNGQKFNFDNAWITAMFMYNTRVDAYGIVGGCIDGEPVAFKQLYLADPTVPEQFDFSNDFHDIDAILFVYDCSEATPGPWGSGCTAVFDNMHFRRPGPPMP